VSTNPEARTTRDSQTTAPQRANPRSTDTESPAGHAPAQRTDHGRRYGSMMAEVSASTSRRSGDDSSRPRSGTLSSPCSSEAEVCRCRSTMGRLSVCLPPATLRTGARCFVMPWITRRGSRFVRAEPEFQRTLQRCTIGAISDTYQGAFQHLLMGAVFQTSTRAPQFWVAHLLDTVR
jgi:hypothetical protein